MDSSLLAVNGVAFEAALDNAPTTAVVLELLEAADAAVDRDQRMARHCLARAAALLRDGISPARAPDRVANMAPGRFPRWQAERIVTYIETHLDGTITSSELIALTPLSASHFFRTFKITFGKTPLVYIGERRIERARQLMLASDESLAQIALACGLCDQSHLNRLFRRVVGTSPWAWRREHARCWRRGSDRAAHTRAGGCHPLANEVEWRR